MGDLYLIRHGQASFGEENYDRLSPTGVRQAGILGHHMARTFKRIDAVYSGSLDRQLHTARKLREALETSGGPVPEIISTKAFDEYDSTAVWQGYLPMLISENPAMESDLSQIYTDRSAFQRLFENVMRRWVSRRPDPPGIPNWQEFKHRVKRGLYGAVHDQGSGKRIVISTSGGPISTAVQLALNLSNEKTLEIAWQLMNASITRFKYSGQRIGLSGFNDVSHLEVKGDASLLTYR